MTWVEMTFVDRTRDVPFLRPGNYWPIIRLAWWMFWIFVRQSWVTTQLLALSSGDSTDGCLYLNRSQISVMNNKYKMQNLNQIYVWTWCLSIWGKQTILTKLLGSWTKSAEQCNIIITISMIQIMNKMRIILVQMLWWYYCNPVV